MIGIKRRAETAGVHRIRTMYAVGERSIRAEAKGVTHSRAYGSEDAGTSNHNAGENPAHRKTKVSSAMVIIRGLVGPKGMAKAAPDGHTVNIP